MFFFVPIFFCEFLFLEENVMVMSKQELLFGFFTAVAVTTTQLSSDKHMVFPDFVRLS
jgi:hypothetical protein